MKKILLLLFFIFPSLLYVQGKNIPLNISVFNQSTAIPFTRLMTFPIHPGFQVGTEWNLKSKKKVRIFQTINTSYFYHNYLTQGIGLNSEMGYERKFKSRLAISGLFGLGYMHTFATAEEFTFVNGQYEKKGDKGNARFCPSISFDIGYYVKKDDLNSPKIFMRYQSWAEYPYSPDFIPVMTHINLHLGIKLNIKTNSNKND